MKSAPHTKGDLIRTAKEVGEPKTVTGPKADPELKIRVLDEDSTGAADISRYTLHGPLEKA
ncbi:hypothetical protein GCM10022249_15000 [Enteractinococcus coprophilus]